MVFARAFVVRVVLSETGSDTVLDREGMSSVGGVSTRYWTVASAHVKERLFGTDSGVAQKLKGLV